MDKNGEIYDYSSFVYYQNNLNIKDNKRIIQFNNNRGFSCVFYDASVNNPLFKENNFFLKSNNTNKSSRLMKKTKKITKLKNYYNNLINRMNNYYSNIYINYNY